MIEKRRTAKKDYIAKKAIDVFSALGYKESSLKDIATKGKFSKAGIYHYFKSKSELLSYILLSNTDSFFNRLEKSLDSALKERLNPQKTFEKLIRTYADELLSNIKVSLLILRERHQLTGAKKKILTEKERAIFRLIRDRLKHVPERNTKININLASFQIMSMIHWMGYWFDERGTISKKEAINQTIHLAFHGILKIKK